MSRTFVSTLVVIALSSLAGCASSAKQPSLPASLAEQVPAPRVVEAPPSDFEFEVAAPRESTGRISRDAELTGSLHPRLASHVNE